MGNSCTARACEGGARQKTPVREFNDLPPLLRVDALASAIGAGLCAGGSWYTGQPYERCCCSS